jgi:hypothetical protein
MTDNYIISKEDFDQFAHQMVVTFPFMPNIVREEWINRIDRVRSSSLSIALKSERERMLEEIYQIALEEGAQHGVLYRRIRALRGKP